MIVQEVDPEMPVVAPGAQSFAQAFGGELAEEDLGEGFVEGEVYGRVEAAGPSFLDVAVDGLVVI